MTPKAPLKDLIDYLIHHGQAEIPANGGNIHAELETDEDLLSFQVGVYQGQGYIPPSVRLCLSSSFRGPGSHIRTSLSINENSYSIDLHFQEAIPHLTQGVLMDHLNEFSRLAEKWRQILDDNDRRDLVHIYTK